jgi:hypothetical protein
MELAGEVMSALCALLRGQPNPAYGNGAHASMSGASKSRLASHVATMRCASCSRAVLTGRC